MDNYRIRFDGTPAQIARPFRRLLLGSDLNTAQQLKKTRVTSNVVCHLAGPCPPELLKNLKSWEGAQYEDDIEADSENVEVGEEDLDELDEGLISEDAEEAEEEEPSGDHERPKATTFLTADLQDRRYIMGSASRAEDSLLFDVLPEQCRKK